MKGLVSFVLSFTLFFPIGGFSSPALACHTFFQITLLDVLKRANSKHESLLFTDFESHLQTLPLLKKRSLRRMIREFDISKLESHSQVEDFASQLMILLYGPRDTMTRWWRLKPEERMQDSVYRSLRTKVIRDGLLSLIPPPLESPHTLRTQIRSWYRGHLQTPAMARVKRYLKNALKFPIALPTLQY